MILGDWAVFDPGSRQWVWTGLCEVTGNKFHNQDALNRSLFFAVSISSNTTHNPE